MKDKLQQLRSKIDELDTKLVRLLNERTKLVLEIGKLKLDAGEEIYSPDREDAVLRRIVEKGDGPLPADSLRAIYREVMSAMDSIGQDRKDQREMQNGVIREATT